MTFAGTASLSSEQFQLEQLPGNLPPDERVLWQGRPDWRCLAQRAFHLRGLAVYFGVLLVWYAVTALRGEAPAVAALATLRMTAVALTPLALICLYAWMSSRAALYTMTDRRLVLRIGIALPITVNLPFAKVASAGLLLWQDGHGSISLAISPPDRMTYMVLWPHAKPWRMARPEPMLRCIPDAARVSQILARALAVAADMPVPAASPAIAASAGAQPHASALA